jgi:L-2,4-diaminobutyric acid acetyltransferase
VWELVERDPALDTNSPYAYLLLCSDFAETGAVVEADGGLAGFVLGYRPPTRPEAWFVWQVGVSPAHRGLGLGTALLERVLGRLVRKGVTHLEATVTPSNEASEALFHNVARRAGAEIATETAFGADLFPSGDHEAEIRLRIGPFDPDSA